jgi:hypothetical protein
VAWQAFGSKEWNHQTTSGETAMQHVLKTVERYPMEAIVARYARDEKLSIAAAKEHERELKRFLALVCLMPSGTYVMNGPIDKLWHTFIIHTREYQDFCNKAAGRFIHHVPDSPNSHDRNLSVSRYMRFLEDYKAVFNEEPPAHVWPSPASASEGLSCSDPVD